tara:strand:- start:10458 stop:10715 length:258 start_codon:yes stop_codon:yes gene_type:complete
MVETLFKASFVLLSYLSERERNRFIKEYQSIKEEYYEEAKKPSIEERQRYPGLRYRDFRDNATIDDCAERLRILCEAIAAATGRL